MSRAFQLFVFAAGVNLAVLGETDSGNQDSSVLLQSFSKSAGNSGFGQPPVVLPGEQPPAKVLNIACVGDSITNGYHAMNEFVSYPAQLQNLLGPSLGPQLVYNVWNFGHNGALATKIPKDTEAYAALEKSGKKPYWDTVEFNESQHCGNWNVAPDLVIIMLGTNDANSITWPTYHELYERSYTELIKVYTDLGSKVYIAIPPPCYSASEAASQYQLLQNVINDELPSHITCIADGSNLPAPISVYGLFHYHCPTIENDTATCDWISGAGFGTPPTPPFNDGIHPNANGYYAIAATMMKYVLMPYEYA